METTITPLNESGQPVDWWFMYKMPKLKKNAQEDSATGYEYIYYDGSLDKVIQSPFLLSEGKGALNLTLDATFENAPETTGWILYNDEMPVDAQRKDSSSYGHTKGVLAFDTKTKTALWLLHSWPKFTDPDKQHIPTPQYGQTFLCLSIDMATAGRIANQMRLHQEPQIFGSRIPTTLSENDPLFLLSQSVDRNAEGDSNIIDCKTRGGLDFKVMAKNRHWGKDFWIDLVGPALQADLNVESWIRGKIPPILDSDGIHKTYDVKFIDLNPLGFPFIWPESHDHAKCAITTDKDWICVGDINRMVSQERRGGGTIAFQNKILWGAISKIDRIVPPPGHSLEETKKLIKSTHVPDDE